MNKAVYRSISVILSITLILGNYFSAGALSAVGAPALATPKTYYVSPTGNDANAGTALAPFKTFTKAVSALVAGDTLQIYGGTYAQQLTVSKSGTTASPITVQPVTGQNVIIDGEMVRDIAVLVSGSNIVIDGLETQRALQFCVDITGSNITVKNFNIHNCQKFGARIKGKNIILEGSTFHDNVLENVGGTNTTGGWQGALRVGLGGENVTLRNNTIYNNWGEGIGVGRGKFVNVYNNVVHDNYSQNIYINNSTDVNVENNFTYSIDPKYFRSGVPANCIGMADEYYAGWGSQLARVRIINNIAAFCKRGIGYTYSENADGGMDTVTIAYNTIWGSTDAGIVVINQPTKTRNSVISNNVVQQANGRLTDIQVATGITYSNNFWVSPANTFKSGPGDRTGDIKFASAPGLIPASYRLSANSSAIAGAVSLGVTKDFAGNSRGPLYDMGAMQYTGVVSVTPTSSVVFTPTNTPVLLPTSTLVLPTATVTPIPMTATPTSIPMTATSTSIPITATPTALASPTVTPTGMVPTVTLSATTQPGLETTYDDKNGGFIYSAGWQDVIGKQAYDGSYKQTTQNGSSVKFTFTGQSFSIIYKGGPSYRSMDVYVDGLLVGTLNENLPVSAYQPRWDYPGQLAAGSHTLKLVFVTTSASSTKGSLDAVIIR